MATTLYSEQSKNIRKTWFLILGFLVVVIGIGWAVSWYYGNSLILYIAVAFSLCMNFFSYWYADKIALKVNRAKPLQKSQYTQVYNIVENLTITSGMPMPALFLINDPAPNAFATGRNKEHASIAVTNGLIQMMDKTELEGVLAHEISHIGNKDILLQTLVVVLVGFIAIIGDIFLRSTLFGFGGRNREGGGGGIFLIIGIILAILAPIVATVIQLAISRKREFLADASGALLTRYPEGLASALEKIEAHSAPLKHTSNATAHMFISNPFGKKGKTMSAFLSRLFMTHPPTSERIAALRGLE